MKFTKAPTEETWRAASFAVTDAKKKRPRRGTAARLAWLFLSRFDCDSWGDWQVERMVARAMQNGHVRELCAYLEELPDMEWKVVAKTLAKGEVANLCIYLEKRVK